MLIGALNATFSSEAVPEPDFFQFSKGWVITQIKERRKLSLHATMLASLLRFENVNIRLSFAKLELLKLRLHLQGRGSLLTRYKIDGDQHYVYTNTK